jgi:hypothetical protein
MPSGQGQALDVIMFKKTEKPDVNRTSVDKLVGG